MEMKTHLPKKILAIDDERAMRHYYIYLLKDFYEVMAVPTNELAIDLLRKGHFDIIISDMYRPGGGGIDLLQFLIDNPEMPRKVLFVSGYMWDSMNEVQTVLAYARNDLLVGMMSKPFHVDKLRQNIVKMLNGIAPCDVFPPLNIPMG